MVTEVFQATDDERVEWDQFVDSAEDAESYHPYEWRKVFERVFGHNCIYLIARDAKGQVNGILPLVHLKSHLFGNFFVSVPCFNYCGTLATDSNVRNLLIAAAWRAAQ